MYLEVDYIIRFVWKSYHLELHYVLCTLFCLTIYFAQHLMSFDEQCYLFKCIWESCVFAT